MHVTWAFALVMDDAWARFKKGVEALRQEPWYRAAISEGAVARSRKRGRDDATPVMASPQAHPLTFLGSGTYGCVVGGDAAAMCTARASAMPERVAFKVSMCKDKVKTEAEAVAKAKDKHEDNREETCDDVIRKQLDTEEEALEMLAGIDPDGAFSLRAMACEPTRTILHRAAGFCAVQTGRRLETGHAIGTALKKAYRGSDTVRPYRMHVSAIGTVATSEGMRPLVTGAGAITMLELFQAAYPLVVTAIDVLGAHELVHMDIKPLNVLFVRDTAAAPARMVLIDFDFMRSRESLLHKLMTSSAKDFSVAFPKNYIWYAPEFYMRGSDDDSDSDSDPISAAPPLAKSAPLPAKSARVIVSAKSASPHVNTVLPAGKKSYEEYWRLASAVIAQLDDMNAKLEDREHVIQSLYYENSPLPLLNKNIVSLLGKAQLADCLAVWQGMAKRHVKDVYEFILATHKESPAEQEKRMFNVDAINAFGIGVSLVFIMCNYRILALREAQGTVLQDCPLCTEVFTRVLVPFMHPSPTHRIAGLAAAKTAFINIIRPIETRVYTGK
jgi:hypothetical protein